MPPWKVQSGSPLQEEWLLLVLGPRKALRQAMILFTLQAKADWVAHGQHSQNQKNYVFLQEMYALRIELDRLSAI